MGGAPGTPTGYRAFEGGAVHKHPGEPRECGVAARPMARLAFCAGGGYARPMLPDNLGQLFDTALAVSPSRPDTTFTFAEPDARVHRVANGLAGLGVRAALMFGND